MASNRVAYIIYTRPAYAQAAVAHMHEGQLDGAVISVSIFLPRRRVGGSPPKGPANDYINTYRARPSGPAWRMEGESHGPDLPRMNWRGRGSAHRWAGRGIYRGSMNNRSSYRPAPGHRRREARVIRVMGAEVEALIVTGIVVSEEVVDGVAEVSGSLANGCAPQRTSNRSRREEHVLLAKQYSFYLGRRKSFLAGPCVRHRRGLPSCVVPNFANNDEA
nr:hypothetical protein CFP56_63038 [Quercus suber]